MLEALKQQVCAANLDLPRLGLVTHTWGNVSGIDRQTGLFVIKPSGVPYDALTPETMVVMDLEGNRVEGTLNPSSDTKTHLELYRAFPQIGGIVHTHSPYATAWAQAELDLDYEKSTGLVIAELFRERELDPVAVPGALCRCHGPFAWGKDPAQAVYHASVLEECAKMAMWTLRLNPEAQPVPQYLLDKHYFRKHGPGAYYGQK